MGVAVLGAEVSQEVAAEDITEREKQQIGSGLELSSQPSNCLILSRHDLVNFDEAAVAWKGARWGATISGKDIDTASLVNPFIVRTIPGPCIQTHHTRHDSIRDLSHPHHLTAIVTNSYFIPGPNPSGSRIFTTDPDRIVRHGLQSRNVIQL